jgi:hypothetical protein
MIFFGVFYSVVIVVLTSLLFVAARSVTEVYRDMKPNGEAKADIHSVDAVCENTAEVSEKK